MSKYKLVNGEIVDLSNYSSDQRIIFLSRQKKGYSLVTEDFQNGAAETSASATPKNGQALNGDSNLDLGLSDSQNRSTGASAPNSWNEEDKENRDYQWYLDNKGTARKDEIANNDLSRSKKAEEFESQNIWTTLGGIASATGARALSPYLYKKGFDKKTEDGIEAPEKAESLDYYGKTGKDVAEKIIKEEDLDLEYENYYFNKDRNSDFVNKHYNSSELSKLNINVEDFQGFLQKTGFIEDFNEEIKRGDYDEEENLGQEVLGMIGRTLNPMVPFRKLKTNKAAGKERDLQFYLTKYMDRQNARKTRKIALDKVVDGSYSIDSENGWDEKKLQELVNAEETETDFFYDQWGNYNKNQFLNLSLKNIEDKIERKQFAKDQQKRTLQQQVIGGMEGGSTVNNVWDIAEGGWEFISEAPGGFEGALDETIDFLGEMSGTEFGKSRANRSRIEQREAELSDAETGLGYLNVRGKGTIFEGKTYIKDKQGNFYNTTDKYRVADTMSPAKLSALNEKIELEGSDMSDTNFISGAAQMGDVVGNIAFQVIGTKGVGVLGKAAGRLALKAGAVANGFKSVNQYKIALELSKASKAFASGGKRANTLFTPARKAMVESTIFQGFYGGATGYNSTLKAAKEAGLSDAQAEELASQASLEMSALYSITGPINPRIPLLNKLDDWFMQSGAIKDLVKSYSKTNSQDLAMQVFKDKLKSAAIKAKDFGLNFGQEGAKEVLQENIQQLGEFEWVNANTNERAGRYLVKDKYNKQDIINTSILSFAAGGLLGGASNAKTGFKGNQSKKLENLLYIAKDPKASRSKLNSMVVAKKATQEQVDEIMFEAEAAKKYAYKSPVWLVESDPEAYIDIAKTRQEIENLKEDAKEQIGAFKIGIEEEIANKEIELELKTQEAVKNKVKKDAVLAGKIIGDSAKVKTYESTAEMKVDFPLLDENSNGFYDPVTGKIAINLEVAARTQAVSVASHELLHKILEIEFKQNPEKFTKLIEEFKTILKGKESNMVLDGKALSVFELIESKVLGVDEDGNRVYSDEDLAAAPDEWLTAFSDALAEGEVDFSDLKENTWMQIGKSISSFFKGKGFKALNFETGQDVFDFIESYQASFKSKDTKALSRRVSSETGEGPVKKSKSAKGTVLETINALIPDTVKTKADFQNRKVFNKVYQATLPNGVISNYIKSKSESKEVAEKTMESIQDRLINYDPEAVRKKANGQPITFGEFIFANTNFGKLDAKKSLAIEQRKAKEKTSIDSPEAKQVADNSSSSTETIQRSKYKNLLESKLLSSDVLRGVSNKVLRIVRTLKSRMDAPVSLNRSITPLIAEIKKEMGKQADIDLKKAMGSKKDGELESFLLKNKKAILENMTTTWLMGAMPGAIQKQVDGKFTSDWQGKKVDRESVSTNNAGKTSGPEIVRRLPNAAQNIEDKVFLGYILDIKGNPIRGRKESLAKALAEEVSFDLYKQQLKNPESDIRKAFVKNQEALGVVIADNMVEDIARQLDRGTVKNSKTAIKLGINIELAKGLQSEVFRNMLSDNIVMKNSNPFFDAIVQYLEEFPIGEVKGKTIIKKIAQELASSYTGKFTGEIGIQRIVDVEGISKTIGYLLGEAEQSLIKGDSYGTIQMLLKGSDSSLDSKTLGGINQGRKAVVKIIENLVEKGYTGNEIKSIFTAVYGPSGIGMFKGKLAPKKNQNSKGDKRAIPKSITLVESDLGPVNYNSKGKIENRGAFMISEADLVQNFLRGIEMGPKVSTRTDAFNKNFWKDATSKYNSLDNEGKKKYLQELQKAKPEFEKSLLAFVEAVKDADISSDAVRTFIRAPFAAMDGIGKITSAPRWMPSKIDGTLLSLQDLVDAGFGRKDSKIDKGVFEHTKPANRLAVAAFRYALTGKESDLDVLKTELKDFDTAFITEGMDLDLVKNKLQSLMGLNYVPGEGVMGTRYSEMVIAMAKEGITFYDAKTDTLMEPATVFGKEVESEMKANIEKGKAKQDGVKNSKTAKQLATLSKDFNNMIERGTGTASDANFSRIVAKRRGATKGRFKVWMPSSLNDFKGLTSYTFAGKGRQGDADQKFFKENLIDPYFKGIAEIESSRQSMKDDFVQLNKLHKPVVKKLGQLIESNDYTNDQAIRVYLWNKAGFEIPGLSKRDQKKLLKHIDDNPDLKAYADQVLLVSKQPNWIKPAAFWDAQTILSDLGNMTEKVGRKNYIAEFIENADAIFSEDNLNKIEAEYGTRHRDALEDILYRMKNGTNRPAGASKNQNIFNNWVNNSIGAIMFFNRRSALLQTLSTVNFLNWSDNNPAKAALAFANQPQFWKDFSTIFNSAKLKQRRSGLKSDINEAEIASAVKGSKNKAIAALSWLLKKGFLPTQIADSFAIAAGGASFYRNRINTLMKKGMSKAEAEAKAFSDFSEISEETQQSGDPALISSDQASVVGRLFLAFQNTPIQLNRSIKKSAQDIYNRRRMPGQSQMQSDFSNISKILYYGAIQNIIFTSLSNALFALLPGFDDDEPTEEELQKLEDTKIARMANGIADTTLKGGFGLPGAVLATIKNVIMEYNKQDAKGFKADHGYTIIQAINLAPPIGSKVGKIYSGIKGKTFNKRVIEKRGFSVKAFGKFNISPKYSVWGKYIEGTTNLPLGRAVDEINAIVEAFDTRNTVMQRIALGLGWRTWDIGVENEENDLIDALAKIEESTQKKIDKRNKKKK